MSQCTYRCVVLPDVSYSQGEAGARSLNAPTGAWCSLTLAAILMIGGQGESQCTYRCVVLPDIADGASEILYLPVSMHLQVRGAP